MSKEIKNIDAALEASGLRLGHDTAGYARSLIEKVDRPVTNIKASCFGLTVGWGGGVEVFVNPSGSCQVVGTELWMDEDEVARRVIERLDKKRPAYDSLCGQINDACAQLSQDMRKKGVALLRELDEKRPVESVSVDRQGLVLTLYDEAKRRIDVKVGILDQFSVALDGNAVPTTCFGVTSAVQVVDLLLKDKPLLPATGEFGMSKRDPVTDLALEIECHLDNNTGHLIRQLGLQSGAYSVKIGASGLIVEIGPVKATVRCDGTVQVERFDQLVCQAPDVKAALAFIQELMTESSSKRKVEEVVQEEEEPPAKKSPKTPPLNLE
jgi:hypothetical protein